MALAGNEPKRLLLLNHTSKTYHIPQKHTTKTSSSIHCSLTDNDMLIMVGKRIRGGLCHEIHWDAKAKYKYMKDYDKKKEYSYLTYWYVNNLYGWEMSQKATNKWFWVGWR